MPEPAGLPSAPKNSHFDEQGPFTERQPGTPAAQRCWRSRGTTWTLKERFKTARANSVLFNSYHVSRGN